MFSGLTNNRETGLGLGIRASHKGVDGRHCGLSCNSNLPLLKTSSNFDRHFTETVLPRCEIFNIKPESQQHRLEASLCTLSKSFLLRWINMDLSLLQKNQSTDKTGRWRKPGGCWAYLPVSDHNRWPLQGADLSKKTTIRFQLFKWIRPARGCDTGMYVASLWIRSFFLRWITADPSPWGNFTPPTTQ